jgi:hypothetical protein
LAETRKYNTQPKLVKEEFTKTVAKSLREKDEMTDDLIYIDGHDNAILGYGNQYPNDNLVIYSKKQIIENLIEMGITWEQALDMFEATLLNLDLGQGTPIICDDLMVRPDILSGGDMSDTM